jgi:PAS domain S-box-containing protein
MESRELGIFRRVNEVISLAPDVEAVARAILDIVIDETEAENASIMMPSNDGLKLEIKAAKGCRDKDCRFSEESLGQVFGLGEGIAGSVASECRPVIIHDTRKDPRFQARKDAVRTGSIVCLPLIYSREELVGVLNLSHSNPQAFQEEDLKVLTALLSPASLALRNAKLMKEIREMNTMLKAELSMTDKAMAEFGKSIFKVFNWMSVGVFTTDPEGTITTINKRASEQLGKTAGDSVLDLFDPSLISRDGSSMEEASLDCEVGGKIMNLEFSLFPLKPDWQILACVRDVSTERFKEKELVRVKDQYKDMVEKAIDAVYIIKGGRFLLTNRKFQEMLGCDQDEILNRHFRRFLIKESIRTLAGALRSQKGNIFIPNLEIQAVRKDKARIFLEISIGRLKIDDDQCYVGVVRDITSKKELLALKTRFLNVASHEIRVPLTVIRGYGRMLSRNSGSSLSRDQMECIDEIEKQCEKLLHFSNTLLDFAKIHSEKFSLSRERVELTEFIKRIVRNMQLGAREKQVNIEFENDGSVDYLLLDPLRFEQALYNLIDNAIKHTPEKSSVRVMLGRSMPEGETLHRMLNRECAVISVIDEGPGICAEEARELFNDFFVGTNGRAKGGIGLGLAITKEIVHAHGGYVEAKPCNSGGHFVITMPLKWQDD